MIAQRVDQLHLEWTAQQSELSAPTQVACQESQTWSLRRIIRRHPRRIATTYGLFLFENGLRLLQPWVLGTTVGVMLAGQWLGGLLLVAHYLVMMATSTARRMIDTRTYRRIYAEIATDVVIQQRTQRVPISKVAARSALSRELVDFFERDIPVVIYSLISLIGAAAFLALYDWRLMMAAVIVIPIILRLNMRYGQGTRPVTKEIHDRIEEEMAVVRIAGDPEVKRHFQTLGSWQVKLSDHEAMHYLLIRLVILCLTMGALATICMSPRHGVGEIVAILGYLMVFGEGVAASPQLVQQFNRIRDIGTRLRDPFLS